MMMILLFAVLVVSVIAVVGVAVATYVRVRKKVDAIPMEEPGNAEPREIDAVETSKK
jgi:hypothetical protein